MYESPINIIYQDIEMQIVKQLEHTVVEAIRKCDVVVVKDELIKALNYDRNQYSKGYKDGANAVLAKVRAEISEEYGDYDICEWFNDYDYEENDISEYRQVGNVSDILKIIDKHLQEVTDA